MYAKIKTWKVELFIVLNAKFDTYPMRKRQC